MTVSRLRRDPAALLLAAVVGVAAGCGTSPAGEDDGNRGAASPRNGSSTPATGTTATSPQDLSGPLIAVLDSLGEAELTDLYGSDPSPFWVGPGGLTTDGRRALDVLAGAEEEGLDPERYGVPSLRSGAGASGPHAHARLDAELSRGLLVLTEDLSRGRLRRADFDPEWRVDSLDAVTFPDSASDPATLLARVEEARPSVRQYDRLVTLRRTLDEVREAGGWPPVPSEDAVLEVGDSADVVADLRARLEASLDPGERSLARRGRDRPARFDSALARGLERFQSRHGVARDGVLGPETARELNVPVEERLRTTAQALERWRWLPSDLAMGQPGAVLVNTAGRRVHALENGEADLTMKVIIGKREDWRTTLFQDLMEEVVVNPYWNVPESILAEDLLPRIRENPGYLRENRFEVVSRETWEPIPLGSVDWESVEAGSFPNLVRQKPGEENALGWVKFRFPNRWSIYLHDTPADQLFDERLRTFSHGCIRVERPGELGRWILRRATDLSPDHLVELRETGERQEVELDDPLPTYVAYQTVWVDGEGVPTFHPDVYDRNERLQDALERLLPDGTLSEEEEE